MMTRVVNLRREAFDAYIGRAGHGQDGYFGNPFRVDFARMKEPGNDWVWLVGVRRVEEQSERGAYADEMLGKYREHFLARIARDPEFRARVLALRGKRLGCFCKPGPCHGDVMAAWIDAQPEEAA